MADNAEVAIGVGITVLTGGSRIEGVVASPDKYTTFINEALTDAFQVRADAATDEDERGTAEAFANAFGSGRTSRANELRKERRREIATRLREIDADDPEADDLRKEAERLEEQAPVLILEGARVWGPGHNPLHGPAEVPFVRVLVSQVDAWWLGVVERPEG